MIKTKINKELWIIPEFFSQYILGIYIKTTYYIPFTIYKLSVLRTVRVCEQNVDRIFYVLSRVNHASKTQLF